MLPKWCLYGYDVYLFLWQIFHDPSSQEVPSLETVPSEVYTIELMISRTVLHKPRKRLVYSLMAQ